MTDEPTYCIALPLDVDLLITEKAVGLTFSIEIDEWSGLLHLPECDGGAGSPLDPPAGFEAATVDWGTWSTYSADGQSGQMQVGAVGLTFPGIETAPTDWNIEEGYVRGFERLEQGVAAWLARFTEWGQVVVRQSLGLLDPSPHLISPTSANARKWLVIGEKRSWIDSSPAQFVITTESHLSAVSERPADPASLTRIIRLANDALPGPSAVTLLSAARLAAQRGRFRHALMELGTALEATITDVLQPTRSMTLGNLAPWARARGMAIPADIHATFVVPRNAAVHHGVSPTPSTVMDGLDLLDSLIAQHYPDYACDMGLPLGFRTWRRDLVITTPPVDLREERAPRQGFWRRCVESFRR